MDSSDFLASENFFKGLTEALPQLIWTARPDGSVNFINKRCSDFIGSCESENLSYHWFDALHPEDKEESKQKWLHSIRTGAVFQHEYRLKRFDGVYHWFLGRAVPIKDGRDEVRYWLGTATDIESHKRLLDDLKLSRDELNIILEGVTEGIAVLDRSGKFIYVNQAAAHLCGFNSTVDFLAVPSESVVDRFDVVGEDGSRVKFTDLPIYRVVMGDSSAAQMTLNLKSKETGRDRWLLINASPVYDSNKQLIFAVAIFRDFTHHKQNEDAIRSKEREFRLLAETIPHMAWTAGPDGLSDWFNQRWTEYTGISLQAGLNKHWTIVLNEKERVSAEKAWTQSLREGEPFEVEYKIRRRDSAEHRWHLVRAIPARNESGEIFRWFGTCTDIHEAKMAQENVMKAEESSRFLAEAGIILSSSLESGNTMYRLLELITPRMADWCRVDLTEPMGSLPRCLIYHSELDKVSWAEKLEERFPLDWSQSGIVTHVMRTGEVEFYERISEEFLRFISQDEEHYQILKNLGLSSIMVVPILGKQKILGAITFASSDPNRVYTPMDLTVAKDIGIRTGVAIGKSLLYESEKRARKEAEEANKAKSTFLANMSHEMRTPLNALIGFNDLLKDAKLTDEQRVNYHEIISRNGELLLRLIDDILDLSKVEAGHLTLEHIPISLPDLLSEVSSNLNAKAASKGLSFVVDLDASVPETIVTDPIRLKQILNNIIGNAIKFTSRGSVSLNVESDRLHEKIRFRVTDTGPGIRPEYRSSLFQPFSQADPSVTRRFGGTGLGLALSKKLAQSLGGELEIEDFEEGKGATFVIEVSGNHHYEGPAVRTDAPMSNKKMGSDMTFSLNGKRILLVEDSPDNQLLVKCVLKSKGVEVDMAENGEVGVKKALEGQYDLVLMDVQMPIMDGYTAMRILKNENYKRPVIALTAHAMKEDRERCFANGCVDYLTKPIKPATLIETVTKHIRTSGTDGE